MCYGNMADNTLPDQIAGMKQLAKKYPYIDIEKVGIWGHSGGGYATAAAMFRFPDFFKVGISESGNHDNRNYEDDWGERYIGLVTQQCMTESQITMPGEPELCKKFKRKINACPWYDGRQCTSIQYLLVVDALNKANKDFDLVIFPNSTAWLWRVYVLYDAAPVGLFCEIPSWRYSATRI